MQNKNLVEIPNFYQTLADDLKEGADAILNKSLFKRKFDLNNVCNYAKNDKIGQGTFGEVFKMQHIQTQDMYALKRIKYENEAEGFPITSLREVKILQSLNHENIVRLKEICWNHPNPSTKSKAEFYLTFELCNHDLAGILSLKNFVIELQFKKTIMQHILKGIDYLHRNDIIHRDIKTSNILIDPYGIVKIADFGLARLTRSRLYSSKSRPRFTGRVVTLWYRAPEILLNINDYDSAVDMWSTGCVFAELWKKEAILPGRTEPHQLSLIIQLCGQITDKVWPGLEKLEDSKKNNLKLAEESTHLSQQQQTVQMTKARLARYIDCTEAIDLIDKLLTLYPAARINARDAMTHDVFSKPPEMGRLTDMKINTHCYEYKMHKQNAENEHLDNAKQSKLHNNNNNRHNKYNNHNSAHNNRTQQQQYKVFKDHSSVCERKY